MARELCVLADVTALVPGYTTDVDTDALLNTLITAESRTAHDAAGREFVTIAGATTRLFDIDDRIARTRILPVGDMTTVTTVEVQDVQGTFIADVLAPDRVSMGMKGRTREEWEPITELWFPKASASPASLTSGGVLEVIGVWGFPAIPADVKVAVAKLVLVRFIADAAASGTALSDTLNEQSFDAGQAFASAMDVLRAYQPDTWA